MSTGLVFLRVTGVAGRAPPQPQDIAIPFTEFTTVNIYQCIGPIGGVVWEGVCGAPIVAENEGGVVGLFQLGEEGGEWATNPYLDDFIGQW